jgi:hypothetical protein
MITKEVGTMEVLEDITALKEVLLYMEPKIILLRKEIKVAGLINPTLLKKR